MRLIGILVLLALVCACGFAAGTTGWTLVGWNDLGMHCMDGDYAVYAILPPYNTIHAQLIDSSGRLVRTGSGVTVTYSAVRDGDGSINTVSLWKSNFWQFVAQLFGKTVEAETGLTGNAMPGASNQGKAMKFESAQAWFTADGIPITPYDDAGSKNYYPMMRLTAKDSSGNVLATTDIVLPVSDEMSCKGCHASGMNATKPSRGWAFNSFVERDYKLNILALHDDRQAGNTAFKNALKAVGYSADGLFASASAGKPILCASCHASNALGTKGQPGVQQLTLAIHSLHARVTDPANGQTLDAATDRSACYTCHPGSATRCLRGVMGNAVAADGTMEIQCQNCHGSMSSVGAANRQGWFDEPNCQACHSGTATTNSGQIRYISAFAAPGQMRQPADTRFATSPNTPAAGISLFRFSSGHGGLQCEACHGSTHAESPSSHANDNVQAIALQGTPGPMAECTVCHGSSPNTVSGGPHGLHPIGDAWVSGHHRAVEDGRGLDACKDCHGADLTGTVLSRVRVTRSLNAGRFGVKQLWRGYQVGCYLCHDGPSEEERASRYTPAVVSDGSATTKVGSPISVLLSAAGGNTTLRIVSQPANGTVKLNGTNATYLPFAGFEGNDAFTFAAWNGGTDSNLATVRLSTTASSRPSFPAEGVVNAASYQGGGVSPGEMVTIFGVAVGPAEACGLAVNSATLIARALCDTRVLFDGVAAPVIYAGAGQVSAMVPYGVAGKSSTSVEVEYQGIRSKAVAVAVSSAVPGIFAADATGKGQGAILNQDGITHNSAQHRAAKGSAISLFATGEGTTDVKFIDGQLAIATLGKPKLAVTAQVGGMDAAVEYAGSAPGNVTGFCQVNVRIPANAPVGDAVPITILVGGVASASGVTLAIE